MSTDLKLYGLIGYPLGHSFSGRYFASKFRDEGITDCRYDLFPISSIDALPDLLHANSNLKGLNVTIPYKEQVLSYLHFRSPVVQETGACNCIRIHEGKLEGHNTDVVGFEATLRAHLRSEHQAALILGTGGAAKAVSWVLQKLSIPHQYVSRRQGEDIITYQNLKTADLLNYRIIINTTPLGMHPHTSEAPPLAYEELGPKHLCIDLIYNPGRTLFMQLAEEQGAVVENGLRMLEVQAEESWRIWNEIK